MAFTNRQSNQKDKNNDVNTRGFQFMNAEGFEPSTLSVGSWNDMLSLKINPALEPSKRSEGRVYDYDRNVSTSLNAENVMILHNKIKNNILPAIDNNEDASIGVVIGGGASLLVIGTGKRLTNEIRPFLAIHKNLNADTKKPEMSMFYEFKKAQTIDNYDESNGNYVVSESINSELNLFIKLLEGYLIAVGKFNVHFSRYVEKFYKDRMMNTVNAIADKVGAATDMAYNGNSRQARKNIFGNNTSNSSSYSNHDDYADEETLADINDLSSMLDQ